MKRKPERPPPPGSPTEEQKKHWNRFNTLGSGKVRRVTVKRYGRDIPPGQPVATTRKPYFDPQGEVKTSVDGNLWSKQA
jgi:hypothetical protein